MNKLTFTLVLFAFFGLASAQESRLNINVGSEKLNQKLDNNISYVLDKYNFNGSMTVNYTISSQGEIQDVKTNPAVDGNIFNKELARAIVRSNRNIIGNEFKVKDSQNISFPIEFYNTAKEDNSISRGLVMGFER